MSLPPSPVIYEVNAWVWLDEVARRLGSRVTLATVPESEWDSLAAVGADVVWLMGVWERSPAGRVIARTLPHLRAAYGRALPEYGDDDVVGSPYSVRRYEADERLGGDAGLRAARTALDARGLGLILDFVPNHVACDHPWVERHPEYFVRGTEGDPERLPGEFLATPGGLIAHGRDPHFPPWTDTLQLDAFHPGLRAAAADTLCRVADRCDGVRCDMAMLPLNAVFERTWGSLAGRAPRTEYWTDVIGEVRSRHLTFALIAEAYWDLEWNLHQLGFDLCYDKRLYDRLAGGDAAGVHLHLQAELAYQRHLVRFVENHDEPRAAVALPGARGRAAAVVAATVPGAVLLHHGQLEGARVQLPVQLGRRVDEPVDGEARAFYRTLLSEVSDLTYREGEWHLLERGGWPDNRSFVNLVAWSWRLVDERRLVVVNLSGAPAQGRVRLGWPDLSGSRWLLTDAFSRDRFPRDGDELLGSGLYVDLPPWGFHVLRF